MMPDLSPDVVVMYTVQYRMKSSRTRKRMIWKTWCASAPKENFDRIFHAANEVKKNPGVDAVRIIEITTTVTYKEIVV